MRNPGELDALIAAQNNPRSSLYHRYITPQIFTDRFGPDATTVNTVVSFLQSQGLKVGSISPNHLFIMYQMFTEVFSDNNAEVSSY